MLILKTKEKMLKVTPCGHRVVVKSDNVIEVDPVLAAAERAGIKLMKNAEDREQGAVSTGVLVAVGPNAWKAFDGGEPWAKPGDKVAFAQYAGKRIKISKDQFVLLLNDDDIQAVLEGETNE